ncbi:MAG TPA: HlyD family efflux transporter periplasmic adaptor subunit [Nitrospiria bacterium]|nr:HlyD family efflux transporter periplasmic adaptor subunit [Nitrospiria bacterium]
MIRKKSWWIILLVLGIAAFAGMKWFGHQTKEPAFRSVQVERADLEVSVLATGVVQPQNRLEIKPPIAGRAEDILVEEGEAVKKGQVLAWMSSIERAALLDAARAKGAEELAHWEDLFKPTPLIAPLNGVIIARNAEPGQTVTAQDAVLVMSDRLIVKAQVDETDIAQVKLDQRAQITLDAYPEHVISGQSDHISYEAKTVNNVTIYEVDVLPQRVPDFMRSGMTSNVVFLVASKSDIPILPAEAIHREDGRTTVLLPNPSNEKQPLSKEVETGLTDGKRIEILSGLQEGDTVLVAIIQTTASSGRPQSNPFSPFGGTPRQR